MPDRLGVPRLAQGAQVRVSCRSRPLGCGETRFKPHLLPFPGAQRRITLQFDTPVDVVTFDSFSAFRQRVGGQIGWDGRSARHRSNGEPQPVVRPA